VHEREEKQARKEWDEHQAKPVDFAGKYPSYFSVRYSEDIVHVSCYSEKLVIAAPDQVRVTGFLLFDDRHAGI
jgi:hypothetical protein